MATLAVVVKIEGIPVVLYGAAKPASYTPEAGYTAINCIRLESVKSLREEMPAFGGIAKASGFTLELVDRDGLIGPLFSRTPESVTNAGLAVTLDADESAVTVQAIGPIDDFDASGLLYIGQETLHYTSKDNGAKTFDVDERGAFNSPVASHLVDSTPARSWQPIIAKYPVVWEQRGVTVSLHKCAHDGTVGPLEVELLRGIINAEPEQVSSKVWTIGVAQETARFDQELGDSRYATSLANGFHYFDGETARYLHLAEFLPPFSILWEPLATVLTFDSVAETTVRVGNPAQYIDVFDTNRGTYIASTANGPLYVPRENLDDIEVAAVAGSYTLVNPISLAAGTQITNSFIAREITVDIAPSAGLQKWPEQAIATFNDYANVTRTASGAFYYLDCALSADGSYFTVTCDFSIRKDNPPVFGVARFIPNQVNILRYPLLTWTDEVAQERGISGIGGSGNGVAGVQWDTIGARNFTEDDASARAETIPAKLAFYQRGEKYLFLRDNLFASATSGAPVVAVVRTPDGRECTLEIEDSASVNDENGNLAGYVQTLSERTRNDPNVFDFGNTAEGEVTIAPFVEFKSEDPRKVLLKIMLSGFTDVPGYPNAAYSVLPSPYGLRIRETSVDIQGIESFPVPQGIRSVNFKPIKPSPAREVLDPYLQLMGAVLVPANIGGQRLLTLVRCRDSADMLATDTILDKNWRRDERPLARKGSEIFNVFRISANYDPATDKFLAEANFTDETSCDLYGKRSALEIKVKGLQVTNSGVAIAGMQARGAFVGIYKTLRAMGAFATKVFTGSILWEPGKTLSIGRTVLVSIADALDSNGEPDNIVQRPMLIRALEMKPLDNAVYLELIFRGRHITSFAPYAEVVSVISADIVELSQNQSCDPRHPVTRTVQKDFDFFLTAGALPPGGCAVECVKVGEEESNSNNAITVLDTSTGHATIVAHGLVAGDRIRPRDWDNAETFHRIYCYLSDSGVLGASNDPGFVYS